MSLKYSKTETLEPEWESELESEVENSLKNQRPCSQSRILEWKIFNISVKVESRIQK